MFRDARGQSVQIGAVLLFGALVVALAGYQAFVVPQQNERVEFSHSQTVQDELQDLRNALVSVPGASSPRSVSVQLGTRYPDRLFAVNPGPPSGSLRTEGTTDPGVAVRVRNARADGETGDFWDGTDRVYATGLVVYRPDYNVYGSAPTTVYEHSALVNGFNSGTVPLSGQAFVEGRTVTLVALNGSLDETRTGTASVDVRPVSASTRTVSVTNTSGSRVTLELPTRFDESVWTALLDDQMAPDGYVESVDVVSGSPTDTLVVELTPGENYTLRLAKAGVGTGVEGTDPAYVTRVTENGSTVPEEGTRTLVVEVRDAYNNPVAGATVAGEASLGRLVDGTVTTDGDGRATFRYEAPAVGSETTDTVEFSYPDRSGGFDPSAPEDVETDVVVQNTKAAAAGSGSGDAPYSVSWNSPPADREIDVGSSGGTLDMQALVEDVTAADKQTVEGATVDFAVNNSTVGTLSSSEAVTDADGEATTTLSAENNGTVRVYAVSGGASDVVNVTFVNDTDGSDSTPPSVSFAEADHRDNGGNNADDDVVFTVTADDASGIRDVTLSASDATSGALYNRTTVTPNANDNVNGFPLDLEGEARFARNNGVSVTIVVTDNAGNSRTCTGTIGTEGGVIDTDGGLDCSSTTTAALAPLGRGPDGGLALPGRPASDTSGDTAPGLPAVVGPLAAFLLVVALVRRSTGAANLSVS